MSDERIFIISDVQGGGKCLLQYEREADSVDIWHTEVPPQARGQGIARLLVEHSQDQQLFFINLPEVLFTTFSQR